MTIQALRFLGKLKKVQQTEDLSFGLDADTMKVFTICANSAYARTVDLSEHRDNAESLLRYLSDIGYISYDGDSTNGQVLHKGWHWKQTLLSDFIRFLVKSVLVPILVSIVTALITVLVTSRL